MDMEFCGLTVEANLTLKFFAMFSRFEFALKVAGFRQNGSEEVKASWRKFADEISVKFDASVLPNIQRSFDYITSHPPRVLFIQNGKLDWEDDPLEDGLSNARQALDLIQRIRNNFFHGGKFVPDLVAPPERDRHLLENALVILTACIKIIPEVLDAYSAQ